MNLTSFIKLSLLSLVFFITGCSMFGPSVVSELTFQDEHFANCVAQQNETKLENITTLQCSKMNITSVDEIKLMPNLEELVLARNSLTSINTSFNPKLKRLIVANNSLTEVDLSNNPKLIWLNLSNNSINRMDLSKNTEIVNLYAYNAPLESIDLLNLRKLESLGLSRYNFTHLDLSKNNELTDLQLLISEIKSINLKNLPKLKYLSLDSNKLESIDLEGNLNLEKLNIRNNKLNELELSNNKKLTNITAGYNQLFNLDVSHLTSLTSLELNNNKLDKLNIRNNPKLERLIAFNNPLYVVEYDKAQKFKLFSIEGTAFNNTLLAKKQKIDVSDALPPQVIIIDGGLIIKRGRGQYDVMASQLVKPSLGQYIGFRYSVKPSKNRLYIEHSNISNQYQFPIIVRMTHPEITNPKTGQKFTTSTWTDTMFKHDQNLAFWYFGDEYELVSGRWTLEILYHNVVIARKSFQVEKSQ